MSKLFEKLQKAGIVKGATVLSESQYFTNKDIIPTELPVLNIAFSGKVDGGLVPGISIFAGMSKCYKTLLALFCMKAYLNKYPDGMAILYDSEFSITPDYISSHGIDPNRVLHVPIEHLEQLKFDIVKRLEQVERGDRVFFMVDSLGALSSKKEIDDAMDEKSVADMTRAKSIRSLLRIISPHFTIKDIPCVIINHIYETMEIYSKPVVSGGTAVTYVANQIFIISKSQDKNSAGDLEGFKFTINIEKSRFVREKSKLPFTVSYSTGINKWSSILDLAVESGDAVKPSNGWYQLVDNTTGEMIGSKIRAKDAETEQFLGVVLERQSFREFVENKFKLMSSHVEDELEDIGEDTDDEFDN